MVTADGSEEMGVFFYLLNLRVKLMPDTRDYRRISSGQCNREAQYDTDY